MYYMCPSPGAGVTNGSELPCGCWDLNSYSLKQKLVCLTIEPSLHLISIIFYWQNCVIRQTEYCWQGKLQRVENERTKWVQIDMNTGDGECYIPLSLHQATQHQGSSTLSLYCAYLVKGNIHGTEKSNLNQGLCVSFEPQLNSFKSMFMTFCFWKVTLTTYCTFRHI